MPISKEKVDGSLPLLVFLNRAKVAAVLGNDTLLYSLVNRPVGSVNVCVPASDDIKRTSSSPAALAGVVTTVDVVLAVSKPNV